MTIEPGTRLGCYQILSLLGAGGMGEVYRARDTQLKRDVAIKVLPAAFAQDSDRLARFRREAELLASLNHPHIAGVHGLEATASGIAIVLELVEGPTLADRIVQGAIPLDDAVVIAAQIAEALEAAHEKGIVHRDLKPSNIKLAADGQVKVLDFGLAKSLGPPEGGSFESGGSPAHLSFSPTITSPPGTFAGVLLGTAAYMSPEQAKGLALDRRTDIFAFGCLLFEMLTGRPAFAGTSVAEILAAVLKEEPEWALLPADLPAPLRRLLRRCLEKDRRQRLQSAGDARIEIEEIQNGTSEAASAPIASAARRPWWLWGWAAAATVLFIAATIPLARLAFVPKPEPVQMRLEIATPATADLMALALAPNGRLIVTAGTADGRSGLWLRSLDRPGGQLLPATESGMYPFWSPDSRSLAFFATGKLLRLDLEGGTPRPLADAPAPRGGAWGADGTILYAPTTSGPLMRVSADGGAAAAVTTISAGQTSHRFPQFLPGGRDFLFFARGTDKVQGVYLASLDAPAPTLLTLAAVAGVYHPDGYVMYARQNALVARRLDLKSRSLSGEARTVADAVTNDAGVNGGAYSIAGTGLIAYRAGGANRRQLTWFDRAGKVLGRLGDAEETYANSVEISPDGTHVVVDRSSQGNVDVWIVDDLRATRLTFDPGEDHWPLWSPDGTRVAFDSTRNGGNHDLYMKAASGAGGEELVFKSAEGKGFDDWSPDGKTLLFVSEAPKTGFDMYYMSVESGKPRVFLQTPFVERYGQFSPDGRWIAYMSDESGRSEIYLRPFPGPGGQWQISSGGGTVPRWRADGQELFYIALDSTIMAVPMTFGPSGPQPGRPISLFRPPLVSTALARPPYDVARDGRFLVNAIVDDVQSRPLTMLLNWAPLRPNTP